MGNAIAAKEDWSGIEFANGWIIEKKLSCAEYRKIYTEQTGDTTKQIKNTHYLCHNKNCGIKTYIERTVIQRALNANKDCLTKCKGCDNNRSNCHYSIQCREKNLTKTPDRSSKVKAEDVFGNWKVVSILASGYSSDHQMRADCICLNCGRKKLIRFDDLLAHDSACECFKSHSCGEMSIKRVLDNLKLNYQTEYCFDGLVGLKGGSLRYDFAVFDENNKIRCLIEFDGEQHYREAGSYFNEFGQVQIHDNIKDEFAKNNHFPLLRIPYYELNQVEGILTAFLLMLD